MLFSESMVKMVISFSCAAIAVITSITLTGNESKSNYRIAPHSGLDLSRGVELSVPDSLRLRALGQHGRCLCTTLEFSHPRRRHDRCTQPIAGAYFCRMRSALVLRTPARNIRSAVIFCCGREGGSAPR